MLTSQKIIQSEPLIQQRTLQIYSPGFPQGYSAVLPYEYVAVAAPEKHVMIEVGEDTPGDRLVCSSQIAYFETNACCDKLELFDGAAGGKHLAT